MFSVEVLSHYLILFIFEQMLNLDSSIILEIWYVQIVFQDLSFFKKIYIRKLNVCIRLTKLSNL